MSKCWYNFNCQKPIPVMSSDRVTPLWSAELMYEMYFSLISWNTVLPSQVLPLTHLEKSVTHHTVTTAVCAHSLLCVPTACSVHKTAAGNLELHINSCKNELLWLLIFCYIALLIRCPTLKETASSSET